MQVWCIGEINRWIKQRTHTDNFATRRSSTCSSGGVRQAAMFALNRWRQAAARRPSAIWPENGQTHVTWQLQYTVVSWTRRQVVCVAWGTELTMGHGSNGSTDLDGSHGSVSVTHWPTSKSIKCEQSFHYQRLIYFICCSILWYFFKNKTITSDKFNLLLKGST